MSELTLEKALVLPKNHANRKINVANYVVFKSVLIFIS